MVVLDTDVLSEPLKLRADVRALAWLAALEEQACVTSISVGELLTGVRALPVGRRREGLLEAIETTLRTVAGFVLAYDAVAARHHARLPASWLVAAPREPAAAASRCGCWRCGIRPATRRPDGADEARRTDRGPTWRHRSPQWLPAAVRTSTVATNQTLPGAFRWTSVQEAVYRPARTGIDPCGTGQAHLRHRSTGYAQPPMAGTQPGSNHQEERP